MINFLNKVKLLFSRDARNLYTIREFGHLNREFLIIVCDPKSDRMYAMYKDKFVNGKIKSMDGKNTHVIRNVLKYSLFEKSIDGFIASLMETLHLPILKANLFYQMVDGFMFNIAKSMRKKRVEQGIKSPFVDNNK